MAVFFGTHCGGMGIRRSGCFCSVAQSCLTFCNPMDCRTSGFPVLYWLLEFAQTFSLSHSMPSNHLILCLLLLLPSVFPSIRVCSHQVAKVLELSISPSSHECSGLSAFRSDWFDNLAVQKTLKSLLQHQGSKPSVLQHSAFFMVQLSHPYMSTGTTTALTIWAFVGKVMAPLFNTPSGLVVALLSRNRRFLFHGCSHHLQLFWSPRK